MAGQPKVQPASIHLFGGFQVMVGDRVVPAASWKRKSAAALVKLLALQPRGALHREQLVEILWPESPRENGLNNLSKAVHAARRALEPDLPLRGESAYIRTEDETLHLNPHTVWVDVNHFVKLARKGLATQLREDLEAASAIYCGELLLSDRYRDWVSLRRSEVERLREQVLMTLTSVLREEVGPVAAAEQLHVLLESDPTREDVHRLIMQLYLHAGHAHLARNQYQVCRSILRRELAARVSPETEELYRTISQHLSVTERV